MYRLFLAFVCVLLPDPTALAQTVSIINVADSTASTLVEASLKRNLRAEGYTVKGGTNEGVVVVLSVMALENKARYKTGVVGHVSLAAIGWQDFADLAFSEECKTELQLAQKVKDYLGTRLIYLDETMVVAEDEERLGEMLATYSNKVIRPTVKKMRELLLEWENRIKQPSSDVINPVR